MVGRGRLVLVATPIGNLGDLSPRVHEALASADVIACEDTRRLAGLLTHLGITRPRTIVVNEHTEHAEATSIAEMVANGMTVALTTDAGMPAISDPGERVVRAVLAAGGAITAVPGPSAVVTALALSGLPTDRFVMEGFLPRSGKERGERLTEIGRERRTIVLFEAPHRVARTIADLVDACGPNRSVCLARELTKLHEELWRGTLAEAVAVVSTPRGEYVIVLGGAPTPSEASDDEVLDALRDALEAGGSKRDAVDEVTAVLGASRKRVYALALTLS